MINSKDANVNNSLALEIFMIAALKPYLERSLVGPVKADNVSSMYRIICLAFLLFAVLLAVACSKEAGGGGGGSSPTEAYRSLYAAVKKKDQAAIKAIVSKKTNELAETQSSRGGTAIERVYENGFTETTFAASLPTIRDERINGNMGAIEVWNSQKSIWEDLPFILENGGWKLAVGDVFFGAYKSPGKGRSEIEKEAANVMSQNSAPVNKPVNTMVPRTVEVPDIPLPKKK